MNAKRRPPRRKVMRKICMTCGGSGTVNEEPPLKGRKKCPTCNGKQWVEA